MLHKFIRQECFQSFIKRSLYISYGKQVIITFRELGNTFSTSAITL